MLQNSTNKFYGEYKCIVCGEPLNGVCTVIHEHNDYEGYQWRSLHNECHNKLNQSNEQIYNSYETNELV